MEPDDLRKKLPAVTRPYIELAKFKKLQCISVSGSDHETQ